MDDRCPHLDYRFYNLNPKSYLDIFFKQKSNNHSLPPTMQDEKHKSNQKQTNTKVIIQPKFLTMAELKKSIKKALSGNYQGVLLNNQIINPLNKNLYIQHILSVSLKPVLQLSVADFLNTKSTWKKLYVKYKKDLLFNLIFSDIKDTFSLKNEVLLSSMFFTYIVTKHNKNIPFKKKLNPDILKKTELYFPYKLSIFDPFLTPRQIYKFVKTHGQFRICKSEIFDLRIAEDMELEPITKPWAENKLPLTQEITFSVVIPSYNNKTQLLNTLEYLALQDYPRDKYEIIVVDDGSTDNTRQSIKHFMEQHPSLQLKAIYFPRVIEQKPGDGRFRAGIARNLGVKYSKGKFLAFLDADILTPPHYLEQLQKEHKAADVILLKRYHLKPKTSLLNFSFNHKLLKKCYYVEEKNYWGSFYNKGFDKVKTPWKYICTYGLSMSKHNFQKAGRFGKNFIFYGFEDTDLGYRLFKQGKTFFLSDIKVYHQPPTTTQQANTPSYFFRQNQLAKTAKIFFYRHLDPEIYTELNVYMGQKRGLAYFFPSWFPNKTYESYKL